MSSACRRDSTPSNRTSARPRRACAEQVHVVVDKSWYDGAATQIDAPRVGGGRLRDLLVCADGDNAVASDGDRLRDRELLIDGDDLALVRIRSAPGLSRAGSRGCCALTIAAAAPMRSAIALPARNRLLSMARDRSTRRKAGQ
jgi:hypothetical protein